MNVTNVWYLFEGELDKIICNEITQLGNGKWEEPLVASDATITREERKSGRDIEYQANHSVRKCEVAWLDDQWLYDLVFTYLGKANVNSGWKYDIQVVEKMQLTRYSGGEFYNFHIDGDGDNLAVFKNPKDEFLRGYVRKLSMSIILNDDYEGGEFQFSEYKNGEHTITTVPDKNSLGTIIIFPSGVEHRVKPVTSGIRYSLVCWFCGPPFK